MHYIIQQVLQVALLQMMVVLSNGFKLLPMRVGLSGPEQSGESDERWGFLSRAFSCLWSVRSDSFLDAFSPQFLLASLLPLELDNSSKNSSLNWPDSFWIASNIRRDVLKDLHLIWMKLQKFRWFFLGHTVFSIVSSSMWIALQNGWRT